MNYTGVDRLYRRLDCELGLILTLHRVQDAEVREFTPNAHLTITPEFLDFAIGLLKRRGYAFVSMDEARDRIKRGRIKERFAAVTIDDGYRDMMDKAIPVLEAHSVPYMIYIASALTDGSVGLWWETLEKIVEQQDMLCLPTEQGELMFDTSTLNRKASTYLEMIDYLTTQVSEQQQRVVVRQLAASCGIDADSLHKGQIMNWDDVRTANASSLCSIGSHTVNHVAIARLDPDAARHEMVECADRLERETGERPDHFAFPYGHHRAAGARDFELASEAGFHTAVTTRPGLIFPEHAQHLTGLPRLSVNGLFQRQRYFSPLTSGLPTLLNARLRRLDVA